MADGTCRTCLGIEGVVHSLYDNGYELLNRLYKVLPVKIRIHNNLPDKICTTCYLKVEELLVFCTQATEVENQFKTFITTNKNLNDFYIENTRKKQKLLEEQKPEKLISDIVYVQNDTLNTDINFELLPETKIDELPIKNEKSVKNEQPITEEVDLSYQYEDDNFDDSFEDNNLKLENESRSPKFDETVWSNSDEERSDAGNQDLSDFEDYGPNTKVYELRSFIPKSKLAKIMTYDKPHDIECKNVCGCQMNIEVRARGRWNCVTCFKIFKWKRDLKNHYQKHSLDDQPLSTLKGSTETSKKETQKEFVCNVCESSFSTIKEIVKHGDIHLKLYSCKATTYCKFRTYVKEDFDNHTEIIHKSPHRFVCRMCKEGFNSRQWFENHIRTHPNYFRCPPCDITFKYEREYQEHKKVCQRIYKCNECGLELPNSKAFHNHKVRHERNICNYCGKVYVIKDLLKKHIYRVHMENLPDHEIPDRYKPQPSEKVLECEKCGRRFCRNSALKRHIKHHCPANEKVFKCDKCDKMFKCMSYLRSHNSHKHRNNEELTFECTGCHNKYASLRKLKNHLQRACCETLIYKKERKKNKVLKTKKVKKKGKKDEKEEHEVPDGLIHEQNLALINYGNYFNSIRVHSHLT